MDRRIAIALTLILTAFANSRASPRWRYPSPATTFPSVASVPVGSVTEITSDTLWPAPISNSAVDNVTWTRVAPFGFAAVGSDCPFTAHGPGDSFFACQTACVSAGATACTNINWNAVIRDCVFRRCIEPNAPILSPAPNYTVWAIARPPRVLLGIDAALFKFALAAGSFTDDILTAALKRSVATTFIYNEGGDGGSPPPLNGSLTSFTIMVTTSDDLLRLGVDESYTLNVAASGIALLVAPTVFGALHGLETFAQLVSYNFASQSYQIALADIKDAPRFPHRGVMLDVSRHYISLSVMKKVIDQMAALKLNTLSIHLNDDQSWPLLIPRWPQLSIQGAFSNYSHTYTPAALTNLAAYGRRRGVRIIPEIDTPSHFGTLELSYPQFAANTSAGDACMIDPSREEVFSFLSDIWTSVASSFPDEVVRIGGDEFQSCWLDCPAVMDWIRGKFGTNGTIYEAYHYYERRIIEIVRSLGKKPMAWLDIHGWPLSNNETWARDYADVTLNVWTGCYSGSWQDDVAKFTKEGGSVVVSGPFYITAAQSGAPHFTWQDMYRTDLWNFTGGNVTSQRTLVHGGELCVWDDAAGTDSSDVAMQLSPYLFGLAETLWSPQKSTSSVEPDAVRAHDQRCRMVARGYDSHPIISFGAFCPKESEWRNMPPDL